MNDFWLGVVITSAVAIPLSIFANLITPWISRSLEAGNGRLRESNRKTAITVYTRRKELRDDQLKRDMTFIRSIVVCIVSCAMTGSLFTISLQLGLRSGAFAIAGAPDFLTFFLLFGMSAFVTSIVVGQTVRTTI